MLQLDFHGKTAIVTGGANGIGLAAARALVSGGADVWIFDLAVESPAEVAASLGASACVADVTDTVALEEAFQRAPAPDILVANAGTVVFRDLAGTTPEEWERVIQVNLTGVFHTIRLGARRMKERRRGSIVLTASTNSFDGECDLGAYNASKAGVLGLLRTAANELGPYQIRVNAVCPGLIRTRLTTAHFSQAHLLKDYFRHIPLGRGGNPDEVASAIAFFASGMASYITGATLFVDGGQMSSKFGTWTDRMGVFDDGEGQWRLR